MPEKGLERSPRVPLGEDGAGLRAWEPQPRPKATVFPVVGTICPGKAARSAQDPPET